MGWDWWIYYEQPPEFIADVLDHLGVESELAKNKTKPSGSNGATDPDPESIFNFKEKVE